MATGERKTKDERRQARATRREHERTRRAVLASSGTDARRQAVWGNVLRERRRRAGG